MALASASLMGAPNVLIIFVTTACHCAGPPRGCIGMYSSEWQNAHCVCVVAAAGPGGSVTWSCGSVIDTVSAAAGPTAAAATRSASQDRRIASARHDVDVLDDVAEIAGRIPERLRPLRLADAVDRADQQPRRTRLARRP